MSQSPDEDSLSSDLARSGAVARVILSLNPLTRIHCLPTVRTRPGVGVHDHRRVSIP